MGTPIGFSWWRGCVASCRLCGFSGRCCRALWGRRYGFFTRCWGRVRVGFSGWLSSGRLAIIFFCRFTNSLSEMNHLTKQVSLFHAFCLLTTTQYRLSHQCTYTCQSHLSDHFYNGLNTSFHQAIRKSLPHSSYCFS